MRALQMAGLRSRSLAAAGGSAYAAVADSNVTAFALVTLRAKAGGDGSRTRTLRLYWSSSNRPIDFS